jgi:glycosyltransferase involved in cell wall biosynthesis
MNKVLRIGLIMQGGRDWMGGTEYIKNIVLALSSLSSEVCSTFEVCLLCSKDFDSSLYESIKPYLNEVFYLEAPTLKNRIRWKISRFLFKQFQPQIEEFIGQKNQHRLDFVYPYFSCDSVPKPYFQHKYLPQFFTQREIKSRDWGCGLVAQYASTVVLSSKTAQADFHRFFPDTVSKTEVLTFKTFAPSAWYEADPQQVQKQYNLPDRFFLVSNQFWQHKNHLLLFEALKLLKDKGVEPIVVCTGNLQDNRHQQYIEKVLQAISQSNLSDQVHLLGLIPRLDQIQLMRRSIAVIQPSLFEGWSTVVEDGRCLGKRLILSDFPVHLEQNPQNCVFFDRHSPDALAALMMEWWQSLQPGPDLAQETIARENNRREVQTFGSRFLEIARGA